MFKDDFAMNQILECEVGEFLSRHYSDVFFKPCAKFPVDLISQKSKLKYEIKTDFSGGRTNRLFIEYSFHGKPSGLATTPADYWLHGISTGKFCFNYFEFDVTTLRGFMSQKPLLTARDLVVSYKILTIAEAERIARNIFSISIDFDKYMRGISEKFGGSKF